MKAVLLFLIISSQVSFTSESEPIDENELPVEPLPLIEPVYFKETHDLVSGVAPEESENYYDILNQLKFISGDLVRENYLELIRFRKTQWDEETGQEKAYSLYVDMFKHPEFFLGQAVQLTGHARKIIEYPAGENKFGIKSLYECWLYTEESQTNPAVIITTEIPEGIPLGEDLVNPVEVITVNGIFYKNLIYDARDTMRKVPMIMAHRIEWEPVKPRTQKSFQSETLVIFSVVILIVFMILYRLGNLKTKPDLIAKDRFIDKPSES